MIIMTSPIKRDMPYDLISMYDKHEIDLENRCRAIDDSPYTFACVSLVATLEKIKVHDIRIRGIIRNIIFTFK